MESTLEYTSVLICGAGPTGAMLSAQLGQANVDNICLEKEDDITTDPRGIALDEDGIRALQSIGVYDKVHSEIGSCMGVFNFIGGTQPDLHREPFLRYDYTTSEGGSGHVGFICHKQPVLEKNLRLAAAATKCSQLRTGCTVTSIVELEDCVEVSYQQHGGETQRIRGKYLVGADGKTGFTRKKYLEPRGVLMQQSSRTAYEETWVALNWQMTLPTRESHPHFPLWRLGYTPEQVYDAFFPKNFRFLCNPSRPAVCGRFGLTKDLLWRFEFVVGPDEDSNSLCEMESVRKVVYPYITHEGKRYGIEEEVSFPEDCIKTLRARPFRFAARSCNKWSDGRVIICGDAAHVFPPFGGQGITSGFRDVSGLSWRLELACRPGYTQYEQLLHGWCLERKDQLDKSLAATVENGRYCNESSPWRDYVRDTYMWLVQLYPPWKRQLEQGARRYGMTQYAFESGKLFVPGPAGGKLLPQVYCMPLSPSEEPRTTKQVMFTDDAIFAPHKTGLLQLVLLIGHADIPLPWNELTEVDTWSKGLVSAAELTVIVEDPKSSTSGTDLGLRVKEHPNTSVVRVATAEEFTSSTLCSNRPEPQYYDELRIGKEVAYGRYIVVRKDRFIYAACRNLTELKSALQSLPSMLSVQ